MKVLSRSILSFLVLLLITLFVAQCSTEKSKVTTVEPLKSAAKEFKPIMDNLENVLKEGNIAAAKDTLNLLTAKLKAITEAEIPERLAANADKVKSQVEKLSTSVEELSAALTNPELSEIDSTVLTNFSTVRINFARLGGLLRVEIPQLVSFHDVLHGVWHDAYPSDDFIAIKAAVPAFKEEAAALDNIEWPPVLSDQVDVLKEKVKELLQAVNDLEAACQMDDTEAIKKATEEVHEKYATINSML